MVFVQFPLESIHPQARKAGEAALCAARQGSDLYWVMHDRLFSSTGEWSGKGDAVDVFKRYASEIGLNTAAFNSCLDSGEAAADMQAQIQFAAAHGAGSVPYFLVNDWPVSGAQDISAFKSAIDKALAGQHPPPTPTPLPEGVTWLDPNPTRPGYTYGGDAYRGQGSAPVVVFQFVNFASAENRKVVVEVWPELEKKYVEAGQVRLVIKHLPPADAATAVLASQAAECAGRLDAFWDMYDLLFQKQDEWSKASDPAAVLKQYAAQLKLDGAAFASCMDKGETRAKVEEDIDIGAQNGFPAAPVFFVFKGNEGGYAETDRLPAVIAEFAGQ
ncbi:MAG: Disulfide bond formation protein D precursor [Chloroflexi bacterium ADurb.Bin180]|nr:MAG: Disulfide bond formation protein D precursor [Chloroflexi bacterium ADurb.Bin180]